MDDARRDVLYKHCATTVRSLLAALTQLEREAVLLQPAALAEREWFELLRQKLIPQLGEQAFLVVAVVGGTNIGKSVIFNHLAGSRAVPPPVHWRQGQNMQPALCPKDSTRNMICNPSFPILNCTNGRTHLWR